MRYIYLFLLLAALATMGMATPLLAQQPEALRLYIDADRTHNRQSGLSIERGIRTAFAEVDNQIQGRRVEIVTLDHRGNSFRSKKHLKQYLDDAQALAVFAGLHSPPLIKHRDFINEKGILTLVPWAAAGPITRAASDENWIYRLSVDDSKAGAVMIEHALKKQQCRAPHLLLEETPWGRSNKRTMSEALEAAEVTLNGVTWFGWNLKEQGARTHLRNIAAKGADCVMLVANAPEGITFAKAMLALEEKERMAIISHWGITGGMFQEQVSAQMREQLSLHFIQSCFSFVSGPHTSLSEAVLAKAAGLFPEAISDGKSIKAPVGFIHAYDVSKLLIAALGQVDLSDDIIVNRQRVKAALEQLEGETQGLVKAYEKPFAPYHAGAPDAHEALGVADFCMAHYGPDDEIIVLSK